MRCAAEHAACWRAADRGPTDLLPTAVAPSFTQVCDSRFTDLSAAVACKQMGLGTPAVRRGLPGMAALCGGACSCKRSHGGGGDMSADCHSPLSPSAHAQVMLDSGTTSFGSNDKAPICECAVTWGRAGQLLGLTLLSAHAQAATPFHTRRDALRRVLWP